MTKQRPVALQLSARGSKLTTSEQKLYIYIERERDKEGQGRERGKEGGGQVRERSI